jgi:putative FmdB family regulatory protein
MPTYEYVCKSCGEHLEVVQSFRDDPLSECPACGGPLRKVFGQIGIVFKGSGFYKTDSRSSSGKHAGSVGGGDSASAASSQEAGGSPKADSTSSGAKSDQAGSKAESSSSSASATATSNSAGKSAAAS